MLKLDHVAVAARTLEEGAAHVKEQLGIDVPAGGMHPLMGTHNLLMSLGDNTYLEVIAIDPNGTPPSRPRWFDLDRFDGTPTLATWVAATDDMATALQQAHPDCGVATRMTRCDLAWSISIADDGVMPMSGAFPSLIEWSAEAHPSTRMTDLGCRLKKLIVAHPEGSLIEDLIGKEIDANLIEIRVEPIKSIRAEIETPEGVRVLS